MGCHLYIHRLDNDEEVEITFKSVPLLDGYRILTKEKLKALLLFSQMQSDTYIQMNQDWISEINNNFSGGFTFDNSKDIAKHRHWMQSDDKILNVGFSNLVKEHGLDKATVEMLVWDIERTKGFMWTDKDIENVLGVFIEGVHYAETN
jgi:hypothetical protein